MARKMKKPTPITREVIAKVKELAEIRPSLTMKVIAELADISVPSVRKIQQTGYDYESYKEYWSTYKHKYDKKRKAANSGKKFGAAKVNEAICAAAKVLHDAGMNMTTIAKTLDLGRSTVNFIKQADFSYEGYCEIRDTLAARRKAREEKVKAKNKPEPTVVEQTYEVTSTDNVATLAKEFDRAVNLTTVMIDELKRSNQLHAEIKEHLKEMAFHIQQLYTFEHNKQEYRRSTGLFNRRK